MSALQLAIELARPVRVLVVEDDQEVLEHLALVLDQYETEVSRAVSAEDALVLLNSNKYDLAFVDLVLPGASGFEVIKAFIKNEPATSVVVMTGYTNRELLDEAMIHAIKDHPVEVFPVLFKPQDFTPERLEFLLRQFHLRARARSAP